MKECARVLKPGGLVAVADFAPHHDEAMREQMGDLRLGIDPASIAAALSEAGFEATATSPAKDRFRTGRKRPPRPVPRHGPQARARQPKIINP